MNFHPTLGKLQPKLNRDVIYLFYTTTVIAYPSLSKLFLSPERFNPMLIIAISLNIDSSYGRHVGGPKIPKNP